MPKTIGYLPGVFDLLHEGHLNIIERAKKYCGSLVVGIVSDEGTKAYKGQYPMFNEKHRKRYIEELRHVDLAIIQERTDPTRELRVIRPNFLFHGSDWDKLKEGHETLAELGIKYISLPYTEGVSSTQLRTICQNL